MSFPATTRYRCLTKQVFASADYRIAPVRYADRNAIRMWRNEQIDLLRQSEPLSEKDQDAYFSTTVGPLFESEQPSQVLVSFFEKDALIGYGGLVHIDWRNKNAEISFLLATELSAESSYLERFPVFLGLIAELGANAGMHKIYTCGYDLDAYRFQPLIDLGFENEARLQRHKMIKNRPVDVLIYARLL